MVKAFKITITIATILTTGIAVTGCSNPLTFTQNEISPVTVTDFKLDTYVSISSYDNTDESVLKDALALCDKYEDIFSMYKEGSELWRINENETTEVSTELGYVLDRALYWSSRSDKNFQISVGKVSELWDFNSEQHNIPDKASINEALKTVDDSKIKLKEKDNPSEGWIISKPADTKIDLGAVSKGYVADKIKEYLIDHGVAHAVINLGGNVLCVGDKHGSDFNIGIRKPFAQATDTIAVLALSDRSAVSSGISERYFEGENGRIYHHIINPKNGYPYDNDLMQTTIITKDSLTGDCLSTLCFTLGLGEGMKLALNEADTEAIFVTIDEQLHYTPGAEKLSK